MDLRNLNEMQQRVHHFFPKQWNLRNAGLGTRRTNFGAWEGRVGMFGSIIRIQGKKCSCLGPHFYKIISNILYICIYILSRSTIFAAYQPYQYPYSHHWLPLCHPIQQWLLRRRSVVVTLPRPRQALTSWRTRNHWWGSDGFVFGFRWCWDCLLDDVKTVKIVCWMMLDDCVVGLCYGNATCLYTVTWKQPLLGRFGDSL